MNYVLAFVVGGLICVAVQLLMDNTKLLPGRIMVILVCLGAVLGAVGIYEPFTKWAGAGSEVCEPGTYESGKRIRSVPN